nr:reverse transcriptase domain-containing protein [Tanacetum cinerariifolium]
MQTRSSSRLVSNPSSNPTPSTNPNSKVRNRRPPTEGYEDAIVVPTITADNFELKHGLLTLVQNKQFFGHAKEDPHAHIRYFNKLTSTLKFPNVSNTSIKLMLFSFSLEGAARIWQEKEPPHSIFRWDDLVSKFINQFFPPSKTTNLRNEITNFQQRFDEYFSEAWYRFKYLLRAYKMPRECLAIFESKSKVRYSRNKPVVAKVSTNTSTSGISPDVAELKDMVKALLLDKKSQNQAPATVKAIEESCITCGGAHSYRNFLLKKLREKLGDPGKFLIPCDFPGMAECLALADLSASINLMPWSVWKRLSLLDLTPTCMTLELADRLISCSVGVAKDVYVKVGSFHFLADFVVVDFDVNPRVPLILGRSFLKTGRALIDVFKGELTVRVGKEAITFNLDQTSRHSANYNDMTIKRIDVIDMAFDSFLAIEDDLTSPEVYQSYLDPEGDILLLELPEVRKELKICEAKSDKSSIDEPPVVELKDLPLHLKYAFLVGDDKFPVIIAKDLSVEEKTALIMVLKSHKRAIAWKLYDINDWDMPFELMCNASDFAIGAVLGKHQDKHFRPIHYASKTMTEAESNYTTMEKEMLVVVYAFEKSRSYLIMNKSIVYTDHSALKYLFAKKDSKARLLRYVLLL